jgi:glycosyltransferase involved in cell wall biosynthesis
MAGDTLRVLMVSKACIVGTYQKKLEAMAETAPDLYLVVVVPPAWRDERGLTQLERVHTRGYQLEVQPIRFNGSFHLHYYPGLARVIARVKPDLVHIDEEPYNLATYHANLLARRQGAKTLWFSWQNLARRYPPPFRWIERYNLAHVDHALVGSQTAAEVWRAKGYGGPLSVIPQFGVDPELFSPPHAAPDRGTGRTGAPVHIVYVGRFVPEKGMDVLLAALAHTPGAWRATFLGSGPAASKIRQQVDDLGMQDKVSLRDWLPSTEMPQFYRDTDVLVLPSRTRPNWTEQFGRVLIEAMACEVAVVGSQVGEIPHVIGDAGMVFPEADVTALSQVLQRLIAAPELRCLLGRRGRERVLRHFTQEAVAAATLAAYRETLAGR